MGCVFEAQFMWEQWVPNFIKDLNPSIAYLELFAMCVGILAWGHQLTNTRVVIFCNITSVRDMWNVQTSGCPNCMFLIRTLVSDNLVYNRRIKVKYVRSADNDQADALSRFQFDSFFKLSPGSALLPRTRAPSSIWPPSKNWIKV